MIENLEPTGGRAKKPYAAKQVKVVCFREVLLPSEMAECTTPDAAEAYWRKAIATDERFTGDVESLYVLMLNTRRKVTGFQLISTGTLDTILIHPREVFKAAIVSNAAAIIIMHNHPSGDPSPSEADIRVTRDLIRGGQLLKIEVLDHIVIGAPTSPVQKGYCSLREAGYFCV